MKSTILIAVSCILLRVETAACQEGKRVDLEHADSLVGLVIDGEQARELIGNVSLLQENVRVHCDRATQFLRSGKVLLDGNVVVKDDSATLRAPRGVYYQGARKAEGFDGVTLDDGKTFLVAREGEYYVDRKLAFFRHDVIVREEHSVVMSDSFTYYRGEGKSVAEGNVRVKDEGEALTITGRRLDHWLDSRFSRMTGEPELVQLDTTAAGETDTLVVRSVVMESYRSEERKLRAIDSVRIVRRDLASIAGTATFFPGGDSILLRQSPVVWYQESQVTGDSIDVFMKSRQLDRVNVYGNAFGVSRTDTLGLIRYDQMTGENMIMRFSAKQLRNVELDNRAISLYHLYEDSAGNGLNKTSGDTILIRFDEGKVASIIVRGGVEGQYVPENLVFGKEESFQLPGFLWRDDRPKLRAREKGSPAPDDPHDAEEALHDPSIR